MREFYLRSKHHLKSKGLFTTFTGLQESPNKNFTSCWKYMAKSTLATKIICMYYTIAISEELNFLDVGTTLMTNHESRPPECQSS